jgi:PIN domain nuclease of toxin-antitoxin system
MKKYLLDTHTLIWLLVSDNKLSTKSKEILLNSELKKYVSVITFWEISLKFRIKKLKIEFKKPDDIPEIIDKFGFQTLDLNTKDSSTFYKMSIEKNKDPFDLMLIWQAINNNFTLISNDKGLDDYKKEGLRRIW